MDKKKLITIGSVLGGAALAAVIILAVVIGGRPLDDERAITPAFIETQAAEEVAMSEAVDSSFFYASPYANKFKIVEFEGFQVSGNAHERNGMEMTEEFMDALEPGAVIEITFTSETGKIWLVFPNSSKGLVSFSDLDVWYANGKCYIPYALLADRLGHDVSEWGTFMCESDGAWEVTLVRAGGGISLPNGSGTILALVAANGRTTELSLDNIQGGGWQQSGFDLTDEIRAYLVPGSVIEINYTGDSERIWLVFPDSPLGWMRLDDLNYLRGDDVAYITYEEIAEALGGGPGDWGGRMQIESDEAYYVPELRIGPGVNISQSILNNITIVSVERGGTYMVDRLRGGGWQQAGFEMNSDMLSSLTPGSAIEITYSGTSERIWLTFPGARQGWTRLDRLDYFHVDDKAYVMYEQIAAVLGPNVSTWGTTLQCESDEAWNVSRIRMGNIDIPEDTRPKTEIIIQDIDGEVIATEYVSQLSGEGWGRAGFMMSENFRSVLIPGTAIEITYEGGGDMWLVFPDTFDGWMRLDGLDYTYSDSKSYATFGMLTAVLGDDIETWGEWIEFESNEDFTITQVRIGGGIEIPYGERTYIHILDDNGDILKEESVNLLVAEGWGRTGFIMSDDFKEALKKGAVLEMSFNTKADNMWLVFPEANIGWIALDNLDYTIVNDKCYIEFEKIARHLSEDVSAWGDRIEFGSSESLVIPLVRLGNIRVPDVPKTRIQTIGSGGRVLSTEYVNQLWARGWERTGFDMSSTFRSALRRDAVLEITFRGNSDNIWLVFPETNRGWQRLDNLDYTIVGNKAYIEFSKIAAVLGSDVLRWGNRIEFESNEFFRVTEVRLGQISIPETPKTAISIIGGSGQVLSTEYVNELNAGGWGRTGFDMSNNFKAALKPGAVLEMTFQSASDRMWLVFPETNRGWQRLDNLDYTIVGNKVYIEFEKIAAVLGNNITGWGNRIEFESNEFFRVLEVRLGQISIPETPKTVIKIISDDEQVLSTEYVNELSARAWERTGFMMSSAFRNAMKPGAVIEIEFTAETGVIWLVFPNARIGWTVLNELNYVYRDGKCYVTFEQIASVLGNDVADWGDTIEFGSNENLRISVVSAGGVKLPEIDPDGPIAILLPGWPTDFYEFFIKDHLADDYDDYEIGDKVTITVELESDEIFSAFLQGEVQDYDEVYHNNIYYVIPVSGNEANHAWMGTPLAETMRIWASEINSPNGVKIISIRVEKYVGTLRDPIETLTEENKEFEFELEDYITESLEEFLDENTDTDITDVTVMVTVVLESDEPFKGSIENVAANNMSQNGNFMMMMLNALNNSSGESKEFESDWVNPPGVHRAVINWVITPEFESVKIILDEVSSNVDIVSIEVSKVLTTLTESNRNMQFPIRSYYPEYIEGDEIKITVEFEANGAFNASVGGWLDRSNWTYDSAGKDQHDPPYQMTVDWTAIIDDDEFEIKTETFTDWWYGWRIEAGLTIATEIYVMDIKIEPVQDQTEPTPIATYTESNRSVWFPINTYYPAYTKGDEIKITVEFEANGAFNASVGGWLDRSNWIYGSAGKDQHDPPYQMTVDWTAIIDDDDFEIKTETFTDWWYGWRIEAGLSIATEIYVVDIKIEPVQDQTGPTPIATFTESNRSVWFPINTYYPAYTKGDEIKITVEFEANGAFNASVGGWLDRSNWTYGSAGKDQHDSPYQMTVDWTAIIDDDDFEIKTETFTDWWYGWRIEAGLTIATEIYVMDIKIEPVLGNNSMIMALIDINTFNIGEMEEDTLEPEAEEDEDLEDLEDLEELEELDELNEEQDESESEPADPEGSDSESSEEQQADSNDNDSKEEATDEKSDEKQDEKQNEGSQSLLTPVLNVLVPISVGIWHLLGSSILWSF